MNDPINARLREDEKAAEYALDRGCAADLAAIEGFMRGPLHDAELALRDEVASLGRADQVLYRNLLTQSMESIAERCWERVFANVALRFRARFLTYVDALQAAEGRFFTDLDPRHSVRYRLRRPILPRVAAPDVPALSPEDGGVESLVLGFVAQLDRHLREAIAQEVVRARNILVRRGSTRLVKARIAFRILAPHDP